MTARESNARLRNIVTARLNEHRQTLFLWEQDEVVTKSDPGKRAAMIRELQAVVYELEFLLQYAPETPVPGEK